MLSKSNSKIFRIFNVKHDIQNYIKEKKLDINDKHHIYVWFLIITNKSHANKFLKTFAKEYKI